MYVCVGWREADPERRIFEKFPVPVHKFQLHSSFIFDAAFVLLKFMKLSIDSEIQKTENAFANKVREKLKSH